jgi:hypothetical protein
MPRGLLPLLHVDYRLLVLTLGGVNHDDQRLPLVGIDDRGVLNPVELLYLLWQGMRLC